MIDGHCGLLPEEALAPIYDVQRLRDAVLADSMLMSGGGGAILIAGSGHVVKHSAVPFYLQFRSPKRSVVSIAFVEIKGGQVNPVDYVSGMQEAYDYLWFTPRAERVDQCEKLRQHFRIYP